MGGILGVLQVDSVLHCHLRGKEEVWQAGSSGKGQFVMSCLCSTVQNHVISPADMAYSSATLPPKQQHSHSAQVSWLKWQPQVPQYSWLSEGGLPIGMLHLLLRL